MCGICGLVVARRRATPTPPSLAAMNETLVHRGPDSAGAFAEGPVALAMRRLSIIDLAGGDQPIGNEDGRIQVVQNGEIYNYRELRERLRAAGHRFRDRAATPRCSSTSTRSAGPASCEQLRGMFAIALWDRLERPPGAGPRPLRDQAALLPASQDGALSSRSELKALLRQPGLLARGGPRRAGGVPGLQLDPGAADDLRRGAQAARRATCSSGERGDVDRPPLRAPAPGRAAERARRERGGARRGAARAAARLGARAPGRRRAGRASCSPAASTPRRSTALAARESRERVSTFSIGFEERSFNELDQRAAGRASSYGTDHHELIVRPDAVELLPELAEAFDEPFADSSALPTYLVSQLAPARQGRALGRGRRRAVRRLLHVRRRHARAARRAAGAAARPLVELLPSSSARSSFDYKAKRFARAAHLPPLERHHALEGDLLARARAPRCWTAAAASSTRSTSTGPLRRDRGRRRARAAPGRRHRHLPGRRSAGEDRPRQHGALARGARAVLRPVVASSRWRCRGG